MEVVFQQGQVTLKLYLEAESNYVSGEQLRKRGWQNSGTRTQI